MMEESQLSSRVAMKEQIKIRKVGKAFYGVDPGLSLKGMGKAR